MQTVLVERFLLCFVGSGDETARTECVGEQDRGLEFDHLHVVIHTHVIPMLKLHIVLLSLADAGSHLIEPTEYLRQFGFRHAAEQLVRLNEHLVAGEDSGVVIPFHMYGGASATYLGAIHHIVVQEGEVMEYLQRQSSRQYFLFVAAEHPGTDER